MVVAAFLEKMAATPKAEVAEGTKAEGTKAEGTQKRRGAAEGAAGPSVAPAASSADDAPLPEGSYASTARRPALPDSPPPLIASDCF